MASVFDQIADGAYDQSQSILQAVVGRLPEVAQQYLSNPDMFAVGTIVFVVRVDFTFTVARSEGVLDVASASVPVWDSGPASTVSCKEAAGGHLPVGRHHSGRIAWAPVSEFVVSSGE